MLVIEETTTWNSCGDFESNLTPGTEEQQKPRNIACPRAMVYK